MPDRPATYRDIIEHEATAQGIPPALAFAIVDQESGGRLDAVGPAPAIGTGRARGLFQLMPETAKGYGVDPADPVQNIRGGIRLLGDLNRQYSGDVQKMLAAYHGGQDPKNHGPLTQDYVQRVLGRLGGGAGPTAAPTGARTGRTFKADPAATAATLGAPPPAPLPEYGRGMPAADPTPFEGPSSRTEELLGMGKAVVSGFDPRTRSGRQALAATAGSIGATTIGAVTGPGAIAAGAAGAGVATALETSIENLIAGDPQNRTATPVVEGAKQAGLELGGQALLWPAKAAGRLIVAAPVAQNAARALAAKREALVAALDRAVTAGRQHLDTVTLLGKRALRETRAGVADTIHAARGAGRAGVAAARAAGQAGIAAAEAGVPAAQAQGAQAVTDAVTRGQGMLGTPPPRGATAAAVRQAVEGPAQSVLDRLGQAVETAAQSGPALPLTEARAKAQAIFDQQIQDLATYFSGQGQQLPPELAGYVANMMSSGVKDADRATFIQALQNAGVETGLAEATVENARHPAMGVLRRVLNAPAEVPFVAAHQFKKDLDEAVNWEAPSKKLVQQATKGIRRALRTDLATHAPYNEATAAYQATVPLFTKGFVKQIRRQALEEPSAFLGRVGPTRIQQTQMLRDVLLKTAAEDGPAGASAGQAAWNAVRADWTHQRLIKGDLLKLGDRITQLQQTAPDFVETLYGDATGQQVWGNLQAIAQAIRTAQQQGTILTEEAHAAVEAAKGTAAAGVAAAQGKARSVARLAQLTGRNTIEQELRQQEAARLVERDRLRSLQAARKQGARKTVEEERFATSSIARNKGLDDTFADVVRATMLGPRSFWGAYSLGRILRGHSSADLIEWAAYSPSTTQALVRLLTGAEPGQAASVLIRAYYGAEGGAAGDAGAPDGGSASALGTPPPRAISASRSASR